MRNDIHLHTKYGLRVGKADELLGVLGIRTVRNNENGNNTQYEPDVIAFVDTDTGVIDAYVLEDGSRDKIIQALTGGITIARPGDLP